MTTTILFNESTFINDVINEFNLKINNDESPNILTIFSNKIIEYSNLEEYAKNYYYDLNDLHSYLILKIFEKLDEDNEYSDADTIINE